MSKCWVYHPDKEPEIVDQDEAEKYYADGWFDSPAKFIKTTDFGVDPDDELAVQELGAAIEGVKDAANGALNIDAMTKEEIEDYALEHLDVVPPDVGVRKQRQWLKETLNDNLA